MLINSVVVLDAAESNVSLSPEGFEVHGLGAGERVMQEVEVSVPKGCLRIEINWFAEVVDEFESRNESKGIIQIEVDRGTAWEEIENRPNPYPTNPIESPDRLYGRKTRFETF